VIVSYLTHRKFGALQSNRVNAGNPAQLAALRAPSRISTTSGITSRRTASKPPDRGLDALTKAMVTLSKNPGFGHWREELTDKRHVISGLFVLGRL
jgi:hypothetical protein